MSATCDSVTSRSAALNSVLVEVLESFQLLVFGSFPPLDLGRMLKRVGALLKDLLGDRHGGEFERKLEESDRSVAVQKFLVCIVHRLQLLQPHHLHHRRGTVGVVNVAERLCPLASLGSLGAGVLVLLCFHLLHDVQHCLGWVPQRVLAPLRPFVLSELFVTCGRDTG